MYPLLKLLETYHLYFKNIYQLDVNTNKIHNVNTRYVLIFKSGVNRMNPITANANR